MVAGSQQHLNQKQEQPQQPHKEPIRLSNPFEDNSSANNNITNANAVPGQGNHSNYSQYQQQQHQQHQHYYSAARNSHHHHHLQHQQQQQAFSGRMSTVGGGALVVVEIYHPHPSSLLTTLKNTSQSSCRDTVCCFIFVHPSDFFWFVCFSSFFLFFNPSKEERTLDAILTDDAFATKKVESESVHEAKNFTPRFGIYYVLLFLTDLFSERYLGSNFPRLPLWFWEITAAAHFKSYSLSVVRLPILLPPAWTWKHLVEEFRGHHFRLNGFPIVPIETHSHVAPSKRVHLFITLSSSLC